MKKSIFFVTAPPGYLIRLDFRDYFEIENSPGCQHDFLEVRDGPYGYSDLLDTVCPYREFPQMLMSKDRHLWIHFKSDENIEYKGFKAVYEYVKRSEKSGEYKLNYIYSFIKSYHEERIC